MMKGVKKFKHHWQKKLQLLKVVLSLRTFWKTYCMPPFTITILGIQESLIVGC